MGAPLPPESSTPLSNGNGTTAKLIHTHISEDPISPLHLKDQIPPTLMDSPPAVSTPKASVNTGKGVVSEETEALVLDPDSFAQEIQMGVELEGTDLPLQALQGPAMTEDMQAKAKDEAAAGQPSFDELASIRSTLPETYAASGNGTAGVADLGFDASLGWEKVTGEGDLGLGPVTEQAAAPFVAAPAPTLHTFYMVRIPKPTDTKGKTEIKMAELYLKEMTETRDYITAALQMKRASRHEVIERLKAAREKDRTIREAIREKRKETDPLHAALNKIREAGRVARERGQDLCVSEKELDDRIASLEGRIAHDTISLQEEKLLVREIRQLNASRDQVCANALLHAEVQETLGQKDEIQARLKPLLAEVDLLRKDQQVAASKIAVIEEECNVLDEAISQLQKQREAANNTRQDAFISLQMLYKTENSRNDSFYQNRREIQLAKLYASQNNKAAVEEICDAQMERVLGLWTSDPDFRAEYVKYNERSTLKRLETLDGRALGPDEEPPLLISMNDPVNSLPDNRVMSVPSEKTQLANVDIPTEKVKVQQPVVDVKAPQTVALSVNGKLPTKRAADLEPAQALRPFDANDLQAVPVPNLQGITEDDEAKEVQAAHLKEQRRQQEMAKAKEAEERKKRQAEKAQAKALARAQKEAERREKEKEKRARKKAASAAVGVNSSEDVRGQAGETFTEEQVEASVEKASPPSEDLKAPSRRRKKPVLQRPRSATKAALTHLSTKKTGWPIWTWLPIAAFIALIFIIILVVAD
ncbi:hypothetical protein O6H91_01G018500 [Diphasiastrum complanatum]|uniref:Uncharacterized protein n=2 Tax=Diphasiastrum complanatum TaxID=34168 RepID=A0ACC2ENQ7_DIPCM|nr:hypothetical protein O6H91_01G018500 [Diphasiastrum complanatum]KAJ7568102.1 hypothetical protein O6H91_01G018500 [Diphasiastrum complanatum]